MSVLARLAGIAAGAAIGVALAGCTTTGITPVTEQAQAAPSTAAPSGDTGKGDPPCGFDVYRKTLSVMSLGKAHGTVRVIKWHDLGYKYHGQEVREGTLVRTAKIKAGGSVDFHLKRKASNKAFTVDIVKGKLTKNEGRGKVWKCEAA